MAEKKKLSKLNKERKGSEVPYKEINGQKVYARKEYLPGNSTHFRYIWDEAEG